MTKASYVLQRGEGAEGFGADVKASGQSTGGGLTLIESETDGGAPWHVHSREDEFFYVLEGRIRVWHGKQVSDIAAGGFIFLPRNEPHAWDVLDGRAKLLLGTVPSMLESFLGEFHAASDAATRLAVSERYGVRFLASDFDPSA